MANPVSTTAYYCAGVRMLDAKRADSLLNDSYAERFMGDEGKAVFAKFRHFAIPIGNHQVRCYLIDELVRARLAADATTRVVLVGAGFDSRAFRLRGGRFVEIDEKPIIERKEAMAPASTSPNPLERVAIDFTRERLADKLAPFATPDPTAVICEGVTMYLEPKEIEALVKALQAAFPRHYLFADLMNRPFAQQYAAPFSRVLTEVGTGFRGLEENPLDRFVQLGYRCRSSVSLFATTLTMKRVPVPSFVRHLLWLQPNLRDGYRVVALDYGL